MASGDKPTPRANLGTFKFSSPQSIRDRKTGIAVSELQYAVQRLLEDQNTIVDAVTSIEDDTIAGILELLADDPEFSSDAYERLKGRINITQVQVRANRRKSRELAQYQEGFKVSARVYFKDDPYSLTSIDSKVHVTASRGWLMDGTNAEFPAYDVALPATGAGPLYIYQYTVVSGGSFTTIEYRDTAGSPPTLDGYTRIIAMATEDAGNNDRWNLQQLQYGDWYEGSILEAGAAIAINGTEIDFDPSKQATDNTITDNDLIAYEEAIGGAIKAAQLTNMTVVTNIRVDGVTLQYKTRPIVAVAAGAESGWTTWHTGTVCP